MNVVQSTPAETAAKLVNRFVPAHLVAVDRAGLAEEFRKALVDAASSEVIKRREVEAALESCSSGQVVLVCTEHLTYLKAYNRRRKTWARLEMTEVEG